MPLYGYLTAAFKITVDIVGNESRLELSLIADGIRIAGYIEIFRKDKPDAMNRYAPLLRFARGLPAMLSERSRSRTTSTGLLVIFGSAVRDRVT